MFPSDPRSTPDAEVTSPDWGIVRGLNPVLLDATSRALAIRIAPASPEAWIVAVLRQATLPVPLRPASVTFAWGDDATRTIELMRLPPTGTEEPVVLLREITEARRHEHELHRTRALVELSVEGFTLYDATANIIFESENNARITGYPAGELLGRSLFEFIHPEDTARLAPRFARLATLPGEVDSDIVRWRHRDGRWIYLEGSVVNQLDDPHVGGLINSFRDVTARVQMERELQAAKAAAEEAARRQQNFLTVLSHELRTPLALVKPPLEELLGDASDDPRWPIIGRNLRRLETLVTELVDFSLVTTGTLRLRVHELEVAPLLREWLAELAPLATARSMHLELTETPTADDGTDAPPVRAYLDPAKLAKAFLNLVGNAIKFAPEGASIAVRVGPDPTSPAALLIEVEDPGAPIPEAERTRIFERFYQIGEGDRRGWEGMGVGLNLAAEMIRLHGGDIGLRCPPAGGNVFWLRLPLGADHIAPEDLALDPPAPFLPVALDTLQPPPGPGQLAPARRDPAARRPRVTIVEDNPDLRRYLALHLEGIYDLTFAAHAGEALPGLLRDRPDLVISDVMMPVLDGLALCHHLREHYTAAELPIILLSAKGGPDDRLRGLRAGANDYLAKPFSMDELRLRIHNLLPRPADEPPPPPKWAARAREVIHASLGDPFFGVAALAETLGLSRRHLQRLCAQAFGQTPAQVLQQFRLAEARRRLETGESPTVADAARAVGWTHAYLSRRFHAVYKITPSEVRRAAR